MEIDIYSYTPAFRSGPPKGGHKAPTCDAPGGAMLSFSFSGVRFLIYLVLVFTPLARGAVHEWAVSLVFILVTTAWTAFLLAKCAAWDWSYFRTPLDAPFLALITLTAISTFFSQDRYVSLWAMARLLNYIGIFYLVVHTVRTRSHHRRLFFVIISLGLFLSVFGLFKLGGVNPFPWWEYPELVRYVSADALSATYGNRNHLAGYLEMAIPLAIGLLLTRLSEPKRYFSASAAILMLIALILSLSRGGWAGCMVGLLFMGSVLHRQGMLKKRKWGRWIIGACLLLILFILSSTPLVERIRTLGEGSEMSSFAGRLLVWKHVGQVITDYPLLGTGPGTFALIFTQYQPPGFNARYFMAHNDYLHFISEIGIPLIGIILWMVFAFYRRGYQKLKHPSRLVRGTTLGAMTGVTALLVHSIVDFNLHIPANAILFTVLAAVAVSPPPVRRIRQGGRMPERIGEG